MARPFKKDDLDALGDLAGLVTTYMSDYASKTDDAGSRRKLFDGKTNARETLARAILADPSDVGTVLIPDNIKINNLPIKPIDTATDDNEPPLTPPQQQIITKPVEQKNPGQLEFNFIEEKIQGFGSVADVIKHFDEKFTKLETEIKLIKSFMIDIRAKIPQRKLRQ